MIFMSTQPDEERKELDKAWQLHQRRVEAFRLLGFTSQDCWRLALSTLEVDEARDLLTRRCPHRLVVEILL